jgi:protein-L-isoaspartate(D-aspartate) O-methyltransferase
VPAPLLEQLRVGGRLVIPVGETGGMQSLEVHERRETGVVVERVVPVRFVPMTGKAQEMP